MVGSPDLDKGIKFIEERTGVRAAFGGVHPGAGTRNALLSLGTNRYLEIIAPDPKQPATDDKRNLGSLEEPVIVGWAQHPGDIEAFAQRLKGEGVDVVGPQPGSRKRPDGRVLNWKTLGLRDDADGLFPFFIEWGAGPDASVHRRAARLPPRTFRGVRSGSDSGLSPAPREPLNLDLEIRSRHKILCFTPSSPGPKGRLDITF